MWRKVIPIVAVLILAWIGLNLVSDKNSEESEAQAPLIEGSEVAESDGADAASVLSAVDTNLAETGDSAVEAADMAETTEESVEEAVAEAAETTEESVEEAAADAAETTEESVEEAVAEAAETTEESVEEVVANVAETTEESTEEVVVDEMDVADDSAVAESSDAGIEIADVTTDEVNEATAEVAEEGTTAMRYPVDPETGATLYDQGMVEVVIEPLLEDQQVEELEASVQPDDMAIVETEVTADEVESSESAGSIEEVAEEVVAESTGSRFETDPVTGASIYPEEVVEDSAQDVSVSDTSLETVALPATAARGSINLAGISRRLGRVFGATHSVLASAKDEASAKAVLPRLVAASQELEQISEELTRIPEFAKSPLATVIDGGISRVKPLADTTLTKHGVGIVLTPLVTSMLDTLRGLVK